MSKQLTPFVIVLLVFIALAWMFNLLNLTILVMVKNSLPNIIVQIVLLILWAVYFFKLMLVKADVLVWTHIIFGSTIALRIAEVVMSTIGLAGTSVTAVPIIMGFALIHIIVPAMMWIGISLHLSRAQREKLMDFS